ncbi:MAG: 1,4-dihydroxy-2-naphthoate octaprenyltransferase [Flavobacteriaceae bacterium]|nr:1,4-dihydroxy-2-naphthoate octaprenyltransferase [Flavobacteriaceae bacterium]
MKNWITAARLRTLPLSVSGIFLGSLLAAAEGKFNWIILGLAFLTTLLLQILSNYANDYGDGIKGTDAHRTGEKRAVASGLILAGEMKKAVKITAILASISAIALLAISFLPNHPILFAFFILLGAASVWAAISYTVGKRAYGYRAMGDLFVFLFFGWVSVMGSYLLYTKSMNWSILLPASAIGLLSAAVLNLNNMRDIPQDKRVGKRTIAVNLGLFYSKFYHAILLFMPFVLGLLYVLIFKEIYWTQFLFLLLLIPATLQMINVGNTQEYAKLDSELKKTALMTLIFALIFGFGIVGSHL